jgi:ribosomal-protein-alanine N-acetyltransferase
MLENISIKVIQKPVLDTIIELKKLERENLGRDASINEWVIPVIIKYGKLITVVETKNYKGSILERIIAVNELIRKWNSFDTAFIHSFYVAKNFRNKGVGSFLLKESINLLKKDGIKKIELTVASDNIYAVHLYEKFGFKKIGFLRDIYGKGIDRNLMVCEI